MDLISTPLKAGHKFPREDFLEMLNEIHRLEKMNSIFITLIHKGDNQDFRLISLVGCIHILMENILAHRSQDIMHCIIGPSHGAFVKGM